MFSPAGQQLLKEYRQRRDSTSLIRTGTEDEAQMEVVQWARSNEKMYPELALLYAIPNGGNLSKAQRAVMQFTGLRPGIPDLHLPVARGGYHGLWIEMKREPNRDDNGKLVRGKVSTEQKSIMALLESEGHAVTVCEGAMPAIEKLQYYLDLD